MSTCFKAWLKWQTREKLDCSVFLQIWFLNGICRRRWTECKKCGTSQKRAGLSRAHSVAGIFSSPAKPKERNPRYCQFLIKSKRQQLNTIKSVVMWSGNKHAGPEDVHAKLKIMLRPNISLLLLFPSFPSLSKHFLSFVSCPLSSSFLRPIVFLLRLFSFYFHFR